MKLIYIFLHTLIPPVVYMFVEHPVIIINKLNKINITNKPDISINILFWLIVIYNLL